MVPAESIQELENNISRTSIILAGVSRYDSQIMRDLDGPSMDLAMMEELIYQGPLALYDKKRVAVLPDPTAEEIRREIIAVADSKSAKGDILLFFFSGHGCVVGNGTFGFCARDTVVSPDGSSALPLSIVTDEEILRTLEPYDIKPIFIIDACFSGALARRQIDTDGLRDSLSSVFSGSYGVLASTNAESTIYDDPGGGPFSTSIYEVITNGLQSREGKRWPLIPLDLLLEPLIDAMNEKGFKEPKWIASRKLPRIPIARNPGFRPKVMSFTKQRRDIVWELWNGGKHRTLDIKDLISLVGPGAYANHSKLSLEPWSLLEDDGANNLRKLSERGLKFAQGELEIPRKLIQDPVTGNWKADRGGGTTSFGEN
jgi:hypothetical protein